MKILLSWLREFVDVPGTAQEIAATMSVRGFAVEGIEHARRRCGHRLRGHRQPAGLHVGDRHRARSRHGVWPPGATPGRARPRRGCRNARPDDHAGSDAAVESERAGARPPLAPAPASPGHQPDVAEGRSNRSTLRRRIENAGALPALRRRRRRGDGRRLPGVDAGASARRRRPADQQHRRRHQLRAARARAADARVRQGAARAATRSASERHAPANGSGRSTGRSAS